jgi:hypothetical protein
MTLPTLLLDTTGNTEVADGQRISWDAMTNVTIPASSQPYILAGTGAPTFSATKGSLYLNLTGSSTSTRLYVNNGTTTWIAVTTAS